MDVREAGLLLLICGLTLLVIALVSGAAAAIGFFAWNQVMHEMIGLPSLTFSQTWMFSALIFCLIMWRPKA